MMQDVLFNQQGFFDYTFSNQERENLFQDIYTEVSPYSNIHEFIDDMEQKLNKNSVGLSRFQEICCEIKNVNLTESPAIFLRNCPVDKILPVFDNNNPVEDKYKLKKTFVSEAFLYFYSKFIGTTSVAYEKINNGDLFHDIYPKESMLNTQSQKSVVTLGFHNDLPNNNIRPDWVNILSIRNSKLNRVSTTVIKNIDIVNNLTPEVLDVLSQPIFFTPHEVINVHGGRSEDGVELKPIYKKDGKPEFSYFETRTKSINEQGEKAIEFLDKVLHQVKLPQFLEPNDFVSLSNNYSLHAREVISIVNKEAQKIRWLLKTFDVDDIKVHQKYLMKNRYMTSNE